MIELAFKAVTKALIGGGGGVYSYIRVLPDEFLLKSVVITVDFKRNSLGRTRIYEYAPPPPINALVSALLAFKEKLAIVQLNREENSIQERLMLGTENRANKKTRLLGKNACNKPKALFFNRCM